MSKINKAYGINDPLQNVFPQPIIAQRAPAATDKRFPVGQVWIDKSADTAYFLTSVVAGLATWALASPGASDVDTINSLSPAGGNINVVGGTNLTESDAGSTVTMNMDAAISLATSVTSPLYTASAADVAITAPAGQDCVIKLGDAAGANKLSVLDSADVEVFAVDSNGGQTYTTITASGLITGQASADIDTAGATLSLATDNSADAVILGGGTAARAITIGQDAAAHTVAIGQAAAGAISIDTAAGVSIDAATNSNFTLSGALADLTLQSSAGRVVVKGEEAAVSAVELVSVAGGISATSGLQLSLISSEAAVADSVRIQASAADGGIDVDAGTGGLTLDSTGAISIDAAAASNLSVSGAGIDLSLVSSAGRVVVNAEEAAADALRLLSAAGGLDANVALQMNLDSSQATADAIRILASDAAGGIDIDAGTGGINAASTGVFNIDAAGALSLNSSAAAINIGDDAVAQAVNIGTGAAARTVTVGNTAGASSLVLQSGTGKITVTGTVKDLSSEFLYASGTNLEISQSPVMTTALNTGGAPTGANGDVNLMYLQDGCLMEQFIIGTQTIISPRMDATAGLLVSLDLTDNEGAEYNFGARNNAKHAYTIGTDAAFYAELDVYVADLSGVEPLIFGFRKVEANAADYTTYSDFYGLGLNNATSATNVSIFNQLNTGGVTLTNSGTAWTGGDGGTVTLRILVSAAGIITATIDGGAPVTPVAMTFDSGDVVIPFFHFLHDTTTPGNIGWNGTIKVGYQA